eukprot:gene9717-10707_t
MGKQDQKVQYQQASDAVIIEEGPGGEEKKESCVGQMRRMPNQTWPILLTELCERFSYYGIKAVLVLYLTQDLMFDKYRGKSIYHAFSMVSYFTGVLGAMIADSWLGKFKLIGITLVMYSISEMALTGTCIPPIGRKSSFLPLISLFLTAIACGNIKPCLAAFGGDQFNQKDTSLISKFFSMFYMAVNVGATFSMIFVPMLRTDIRCYDGDCYPITFGVPMVLMVVGTIAFLAASKMYVKKLPEGNMMIRVFRIIGNAIGEGTSNRKKGIKHEHWLHHAQYKYSMHEIEDTRALLKVLVLYIPLPVFWALFHQQGSSWTLQAEQMDGDLGSLGTLRSDQIQFFNPVLVLILIPFYDTIIYPVFERCRCGLTPLKRMVGGMFLAAIAFAICGFVQIKIQTVNAPPAAPTGMQTRVEFINVAPCERVEIQPSSFFKVSLGYAERSNNLFGQSGSNNFRVRMAQCFGTRNKTFEREFNIHLNATFQTVLLGLNSTEVITPTVLDHQFPKADINTANSHVRILYCPGDNDTRVDITLTHVVEKKKNVLFGNKTANTAISSNSLLADEYGILLKHTGGKDINLLLSQKRMRFGTFGTYTVVVMRHKDGKNSPDGMYVKFYEDVGSTSVHRIWQLPQYVVLTAGEVMFSVTGLEFAYSQAPASMKSVLQACWLLTVAFGDLIVVILSEVKPVKGVEKEMFLYGGLMVGISIIFAIMASFYTYNDYSGNKDKKPQPLDDKFVLEEKGEDGIVPSASTTTL